MIEFNLNSPIHVSCLFFGGSLKEDIKIENGVFKGGKTPGAPKYKSVKQVVDIAGFGISPIGNINGKGVYSVDEEVLKRIGKQNNKASEAAKILLEIRSLQKMISTYYEGIEKVLYEEDSCVHATYTHVLIPTSRLSCSNPNMQNVIKPPEKVTEHFVSRFNGSLVVADYKSLEPRVEAELCGDKTLRRDVEEGIDVHTKNLALAEKMSYKDVSNLIKDSIEWQQKRSKIKGFTFSQQYLAGIKTTAKNSGLTEKEVEYLLEARKKEYPELYKWHDRHQKEVEAKSYYKNFAGMMFKFNKYEPKPGGWSREPYYSKNEISNYESQGTAWLLAGSMIGRFWREKALYNRNIKCLHPMCDNGIIYGTSNESVCLDCKGTGKTTKYVMINTIHDNLMLDCRDEYIEQAKNDLKLLTNWKDICKLYFKYDWTVNIEIDIKTGKSWYDCF